MKWERSHLHQQTAHCNLKTLRKTMIFAFAKPCENLFAKLCETINCKAREILQNAAKPYLRKCVKACESLPQCEIIIAKTCEMISQISPKSEYFCESITAKVCENTCILNSQNLTKDDLRKPNCETFWNVYLLQNPTHTLRQGQLQPRLLSMGILNVFRLFIITIPKPIASAIFLSFSVPNASLCIQTNLRWNTRSVTHLLQVHKIVYNLPDLSCSHIFFRFKLPSRRSLNDRTPASLITLSLNVFSISPTMAEGRLKKTSLAIERNLTNSRLSVLLLPSRLNLPVSQFYNRFAILQGWSVNHLTTHVPSNSPYSLAVCTLNIVPDIPNVGLMTYLHEQVATIVGLHLSSSTLPFRLSI